MPTIIPVQGEENIRIRVKADPTINIITGGTSSFITGVTNIGVGSNVFKTVNAQKQIELRTISGGTNVTVGIVNDTIVISSSGGGSSSGVTYAEFNTYTGTTAPNQFVNKTLFNAYSGATQTTLNSKVDDSTLTTLTGTTLPATYVNKTLFNSYSGSTNTRISTIESSYITGGTNVGNGEGVFGGLVSPKKLGFKNIKVTSPLSISSDSIDITIGYTGSTGGSSGVTYAEFNTYTGTTAPATFVNKTLFNAYSGATQTALNSKVDDATLIILTGTTLPATYVNKTLFNSYSGTTNTRLNLVESTYVTGGTNQGSGQGFYIDTTSKKNNFKSLKVGSNLAISGDTSSVTINFTGTTGGGGFDPSGTTSLRLGYSLSGNRLVYYSMFAADADESSSFGSAGMIRNSGVNGAVNYYNKGTEGWYWMNFGNVLTGGTNILELTQNGLMTLRHPYGGSNSFTIASGTGSTLADIIFNKGNNGRWIWRTDSGTESGSNVGSDFQVQARADDGSYLFSPILIKRSTGRVSFPKGINPYDDIVSLTGATTLTEVHGGKTIEANGTFTITLPNSMVTGMKVTIVNVGTGVITIAASGTIKSLDSRTKLRFQYAGATAYHRGSNDWMLIGNLQD